MTPWTVARQAPQSMGFSRQGYWSGLPFPPSEDLPDPGIKPTCPVSPALQAYFLTSKLCFTSKLCNSELSQEGQNQNGSLRLTGPSGLGSESRESGGEGSSQEARMSVQLEGPQLGRGSENGKVVQMSHRQGRRIGRLHVRCNGEQLRCCVFLGEWVLNHEFGLWDIETFIRLCPAGS